MEHPRPQIALFHLTFDLSVILMTTISSFIVFISAYLPTLRATTNTDHKWQNFMEWVIEFVQDIMETSMV